LRNDDSQPTGRDGRLRCHTGGWPVKTGPLIWTPARGWVENTVPTSNGDQMDKTSLELYSDNIHKTGFSLEYSTSNLLKENGWTVINNKYYIDDQQQTVREIDLVAYKARQIQQFWVYTTLIVSCKKSEQNIWALLSKELDQNDPNVDWRPLHIWSNDKALDYMITQPSFKEKFFADLADRQGSAALRVPLHHVFAFQEMNKQSGKPQNDKHIFESITSLMKAQAYELDALEHRKKIPVIYQFNLISVIDSDLIRLQFSKSSVKAIPEDDLDYVANYIVNKRETFARIHFIRSNKFGSTVTIYNNLHEFNCIKFDNLGTQFYLDAYKDNKKQAVFVKPFFKDLLWRVRIWLSHKFKIEKSLDSSYISWNEELNVLQIQLDLDYEHVEFLNEHEYATKITRTLLKKYFRFEKEFAFCVEEIPF
jgi:hypothetical protein